MAEQENGVVNLKVNLDTTEADKLVDMNNRTLYNKLTGKSHFTYPEYLKLRELFPDRNIDYLLTADQDSIQSSAPPDRGAGASIIER